MTTVYMYLTSQWDSMFTLLHCLGLGLGDFVVGGYDDVAEALANICDVNTKLRRVQLEYISPLPVMESLAARQVPLEELDIFPPSVC